MADISSLVDYYANLLIIQYHDQPNAIATIELLANSALADGVAIDVQNAYNIDDEQGATAIGLQLDVIGKYVGINRYFSTIDLINYSSLVTYSQVSALPDSPPQWGITTYADFADYDYNGTLLYNDIVTSQNALSDANFLILIRLAILRNNMNFSNQAIDSEMWNLFGGSIRPEQGAANMIMFYFLSGAQSTLVQAILAKNLLPKPMGVRLLAVINIITNMFSFVEYAAETSPFGYGFSTYDNYDSLAGQVLLYSQIIES